MPKPAATAVPAAHVASQIIDLFGDRLHDQAICLTTPVPNLVPLAEVTAGAALQTFLTRYEPRVAKSGLYEHQAKVIRALDRKIPDVVMTTATGSGKSLAFLAWAHEILAADKATLIAAFPTQALLWGQAKRLANISDPKSLVEFEDLNGVYFAGTIKVEKSNIPWSVLYGTSGSSHMKKHEQAESFRNARLRICSLDKVHWSLMREKEAEFLSRLRGIIIDEAHMWHGLAGANVRSMINRLHLSIDVLGSKRPSFFLASATLADAIQFAESLTGVRASSFLEVNDKGAAKATTVAAKDVLRLLSQRAQPGLLRRYVFLLKPQPVPLAAREVLGRPENLGLDANALCFVQSKFAGHRLRGDLQKTLPGREVIAYDGDLSAEDRRKIESELFGDAGKPKVIVGTSALELGVDLPALDVVVMDELPPRRSDLLQRLGRVGRSAERPGLAVLCLGYSPADERLIEEPLAAVSTENIKRLSLPLHLDVVRLRAIKAAFEEWRWRLQRREASWTDFNAALNRHFGWSPTVQELKSAIKAALGDVVELDEGSWFYKGFRASASQGKRGLYLDGKQSPVAVIDDISVFRDAHPEGVYLGHRGYSYRVLRYEGDWKVATWGSPQGTILGKWMKGLNRIIVREECANVATRGRWKDSFDLHQTEDLERCERPATGALTFGIFNFVRKFDGYRELDLTGRSQPKDVSLAEVAKRFNMAVEGDQSAPFLPNFSYRTRGWKWPIVRVLDTEARERLCPILAPLLQAFFCDAVECSGNDLQVVLDAQAGELRVVDSTPGGNGLSEAVLTEGRMPAAWATALNQVETQARKPADAFRRYLAEEYRCDSDVSGKEMVDALKRMANAWNG